MRGSLKSALLSFMFFLPLSVHAQPVLAQGVEATGKLAYPGNYTPVDIMAEQMESAYAADPGARIHFRVSVPLVRNDHILVDDVAGLPIQESTDPRQTTSATIAVPFSADDFRQGARVDTGAFLQSVNTTLERLKVPVASRDRDKTGIARPRGIENDANCSGFPLGTTLTITVESCLGTTRNEYTCMSSQANSGKDRGGKDWFVTSSEYSAPPADAVCLPNWQSLIYP